MTLQKATCEIGNAFIQKALVQLINTKEKTAVNDKANFFQVREHPLMMSDFLGGWGVNIAT